MKTPSIIPSNLKIKKTIFTILAIGIPLSLPAFGQTTSKPWSTISGGGGFSETETHQVNMILGDPISGISQGGSYTLSGGVSAFLGPAGSLSNPRDKAPRFTNISVEGDVIRLVWESIAGRSYQVRTKPSLNDSIWNDLGFPVVASASSTSASVPGGVSTNATRVYQVVLLK